MKQHSHRYIPVFIMLVLTTISSVTVIITHAVTHTAIPLTSLVDPCSLTFENLLSYEVVTLPSGLRVKTITIYNIPEGYVVTLVTESPDIKVDVQGTTGETVVSQPVFCIMSVNKMFEARIGPLIPPFALKIIVDGEEYLITQNRITPTYVAGQAMADSSLKTTVTPLTQTQTNIEREEDHENEAEEKEIEAEDVQEINEEIAEEKGEAQELSGAGRGKDIESGTGSYLIQTLPLAVGTMTFVLAYLLFRKIL